ncbi:PucR family transcriptional regulator ligand-binding domain-containing protein [Schnuerera sp. xch1]|uniref:PucR family transcriptional regulator ligand-binding domain-containing protein n=1 Tax=Schnuerera sp. xch1 TaxID=2874283 RepID=UPI001CBE4BC7|nr:PucR family transcriptional regulator ligand-binding domain-containing protein [Schnuerera sp. xch1]MBZ2174037.1 PucR family transcriptional regulator ligand-binding domain-containing protein [Schnuerera sp. xch1]
MIVKDLFKLNNDFKQFKLLAGEGGLENEIKCIDVMEVPDGMYWINPGHFIITTRYSIKKADTTLEYIIENMIKKNTGIIKFLSK